jgi:hypothetical protein
MRFLIGIICFAMLTSAPAYGQVKSEFEKPPARTALEVLPEWMANGEYWTVADEVTSYDSLHQFTVQSQWGEFEVYGEPMLRIRLKELNAIGLLKQKTGAKVARDGAIDGATLTVRQSIDLVSHPVKSAKAAPKGIVRLFKRIGYDVVELGADVVDVGGQVAKGKGRQAAKKAGQAGLKYGKRWTGVEFEERLWTQRLGVDPYTSNPLLRKQLLRVAGIDAGTKFGVSMVNPVPGIGLIAAMSEVYQVIWEKDHRELIEWIGLRLKEMGVGVKRFNRLVYSEALPPGHLTLFVAALMQMEDVENRNILVGQAALLETEAEGMFFLECAMMAVWYHANHAPLSTAVPGTLIPVFLTQDGRLIAFSAADWAYWTKLTAETAKEFNEVYAEYTKNRTLWVSDRVSRRFITGMEGLGWKVRAGIRPSVVPLIPWALGNELVRSGVPEDEEKAQK